MIYRNGKPVREFRCQNCRTLLGLECVFAGYLEIKCYNCNHLNVIDFKTTKAEIKKLFHLDDVKFNWNDNKGGENIKQNG